MPFDVICPQCQSTLRVPDSTAGRNARCPKCSSVFLVPDTFDSARSKNPGISSQSEKYYVDSVSGETYGPITKPELDEWVYQSRVTAACRIRSTRGRTLNASTMYPSLVAMGGGANPYASPVGGPKSQGSSEPCHIDLGTCFNYAWGVFNENLGLLVGVSVTFIPIRIVENVLEEVIDKTDDGALLLMCFVGSLVVMFVNIFLTIGQIRISLKLCRGQEASYEDLFKGGDRVFHVFALSLVVAIPLVLGFMLLIIPGLLLMAIYWPSLILVVDKKAGVLESLPFGGRIGLPNIGSSIVLGLAGIGLMLLGLLMLCIGIFLTGPYVSLLFTTAYLMMMGEVRSGAEGPRAQ